jgi:putative intracellular protease/amidase
MYDSPDNEGLQRITREIFERGGIVASFCHGYCGLLNTKLSDGSYLVAGREMTGFSWKEEVLARVNKLRGKGEEARSPV